MGDERSSSASAHLDALRVLAALVVFLGHVRQYLFVQWQPEFRGNLVARAVYFTTGFGHEAVIVFFVLSGYFVGGSVLRAHRAGQWSWQAYLVARLTRLWLVLLPALALGAIFDAVTLTHYFTRLQAGPLIAERFSARAWLGNLFFLQEIVVGSFGSNTPLWSLSYELWYYVAFPFLVAAILGPRRVLNAAALLAVLVFTGRGIASYFAVWLMGAAVRAAPPLPRRWSRAAVGAALAALAPLLVVLGTRPGYRSTFAADVAVGVLVALAVAGVHSAGGRPRPRYARLARSGAGWSYSLYLVHFPPVLLMSVLLFPSAADRWLPTACNGLLGAAIALAVLAYAYLVSRVTEAHTDAARRWVLRRLGDASARGAP